MNRPVRLLLAAALAAVAAGTGTAAAEDRDGTCVGYYTGHFAECPPPCTEWWRDDTTSVFCGPALPMPR